MPQQNPQHQQTTPQLDWLFVAFLKDGSVIEQGPDDKPREQPEGSAFTDVMAHIDDVVAFELRRVDNPKRVVTVDLLTGNFVVNGEPICTHNQYFEAHKYPLKLVYFRETRVDQDQLATVQEDMSIKTENQGQPRHYVNRYFIGWETVVNGKSKQQTIAVG